MLFQMKEVQFWSFMFHLLNSSRKKCVTEKMILILTACRVSKTKNEMYYTHHMCFLSRKKKMYDDLNPKLDGSKLDLRVFRCQNEFISE